MRIRFHLWAAIALGLLFRQPQEEPPSANAQGLGGPPGLRLYVANSARNTISVLDPSRMNPVVAQVPVGRAPQGVAVSPDGTRLYVTNPGDGTQESGGTVSVIDTALNRVI